MTKRQRVYAEATFKREGANQAPLARVPNGVRARFAAQHGDKLIFEEGCEAAVQRAALRGPYFVVRLERAPQPVEAQAVAQTGPAAPATESLAEAVRRKLAGDTAEAG